MGAFEAKILLKLMEKVQFLTFVYLHSDLVQLWNIGYIEYI